MNDQESKPSKPASEQITDVLVKVFVTGSGSFSLYYLVSQDIAKAIIAGGVAFGASLMTNFWEGFGSILKPGAKKVGEEAGKVVEKAFIDINTRITDFPSLYRESLKTYCASVELEGFQSLPGLAIKDIFVPLRIESAQSRLLLESPKEIWHFLPYKSGNFPHRRIAILAAPGYGKTTLMRHLTYVYLTNPPNNILPLLPIFLRLREIYDLIPFETPSSLGKKAEKIPNLSDIIVRHLEKNPQFQELKPTRQWFEDNFKHGKLLVLLDGLDEVPKTRQEALREWVDRQMKAYSNTQFILTSRPHAFEQKADKPSYSIQTDCQLKVLDFTNDQKQDFINKWYRTLFWTMKWEPAWRISQDGTESEHLSKELAENRSNEEADESARNLTDQLFALQSVNDLAKNPLLITMIAATHNANTEIPKRRVELYEEMCKLILGTRPSVKKTKLTLTATQNKRVLQVLAWHLMDAEATQFSPEQGEEWIREILSQCCREGSLSSANFFLEMLETAGLLLEKELSQYEFTHQTFQEYFAALHLREMGEIGEQTLLKKLENGRWLEVICFYAALGNASRLINAALDNPNPYTLKLANRLKNEGRDVDRQTIERLNSILSEGNLENSELAAEVSLEQRFRNLTPIDDKSAISQPIIWGEYQLFLESQTTRQFHSSAEVRQISPEMKGKPVTGISDKDAQWFCCWLSTQANLQSEDAVYDYRLPTEAEREKAISQGIIDNSSPSRDFLRVVRVQLPNRYKGLLNYLANARWREADEETSKVMLEVAGQKDRGYLRREDIDKFPCEDLGIINRLWLQSSGGKFGFSVQAEIYRSFGGTREYNEKVWNQFGDAVGWRVNNSWLYYSDITFDLSSPPKGHLPGINLGQKSDIVVSSLASRLVDCNI